MAYAVTAWKSSIIPCDGPSRQRGVQRVEMRITGLAADTDCDIGDLAAGAFWTAAEANATYGTTATKLKTHLSAVYPKASEVLYKSSQLDTAFIRVAAGPAGAQYVAAKNGTSGIPEFTFVAASGPTSLYLTLEFPLLDEEYPETPEMYGTI